MKSIPLNRVAFRSDLAALLCVSESYIKNLISPPNGKEREWYEAHRFPKPFYVSPSGIKVWFVEDIERWCRSLKMKRTTLRAKRIGSGFERPEIVERVLGL